MILKAFMELDNLSVFHSVQDLYGNEIASGNGEDSNAFVTLSYNGKAFRFGMLPVKIKKNETTFPLPRSSRSKTALGHQVTCNGQVVMRVYTEPVVCAKKWLFKRCIGITVYQYHGQTYQCSKIGFAGESSHYYCLKTEMGETLCVIERHTSAERENRATIYLKEDRYLELALLVCANEIMRVYFTATDDRLRDSSAGHYISLTDAEKSMYDKNFIPAVKAMHGIYD